MIKICTEADGGEDGADKVEAHNVDLTVVLRAHPLVNTHSAFESPETALI